MKEKRSFFIAYSAVKNGFIHRKLEINVDFILGNNLLSTDYKYTKKKKGKIKIILPLSPPPKGNFLANRTERK